MKYTVTLMGNLFFIITGWFVVPILYWLSGRGADQFKYLDKYYGNDVDTIRGDTYWRYNQAPDLGGENSLRNVWTWAAWRNPAKNRHLRAGVSGVVKGVRLKGKWGQGRACLYTKISGERHAFTWWVLKWPAWGKWVVFILSWIFLFWLYLWKGQPNYRANLYFELMYGPKVFPTVIDYAPDGSPLEERPLRVGDSIKNAAIAFRIRPFIKKDWDKVSVAKTKGAV